MPFIVNGQEIQVQVCTIPDERPTTENRFGVSLDHAQKFIAAFKNQQIGGYKMCHRYPMTAESASPHADTFAWNLIEYKVFTNQFLFFGIY